LAFSSRLTRGRGVHKGGKIFLPGSGPLKVPTLSCGTIDIPEESKTPVLAMVLQQIGARMLTRARCLDPLELAIAKPIYQNSLVYDDISSATASEGVEIRSPSLLSGVNDG
jgi:hypothetical protein